MGEVLGADPDALEALAGQFTRRAAMVEDRRSAVTGMLEGVEWTGADADRFRHDWRTRQARDLDALVEDLRSMAATLRRQAADQRHASAGGATTSGRRSAPVAPPARHAGAPRPGPVDRPARVPDLGGLGPDSRDRGLARTLGDVDDIGATTTSVPVSPVGGLPAGAAVAPAVDVPRAPAVATPGGPTGPRPAREVLDDIAPPRAQRPTGPHR